jgi:membrane associated rhomboid family serine protease
LVSARPRRGRVDWSQVRITRGALILLGLQVGLSLVWLMSNQSARDTIRDWVVATPRSVFHEYKFGTLVTSPLLEPSFISLLFTGLMLWMLMPTLERFWGTARFIRFAAITSVLGTLAGCAAGLLLDGPHLDVAIFGYSPMIYAGVVAFGVIYARQPVQFFGVLPLSGRQFMYGILGFVALFVVLQGLWSQGAAYVAAMLAAAVMTSKRWSPSLAWKRWRIARARRRLSVIEGGVKPKPKRDEQRWLN